MRTRSPAGLSLAPLLVLLLAAVPAHAQNPSFILSWGSYGQGEMNFHSAGDVAVDPSGNVYVSDAGQRRVKKFTSNGLSIVSWPAGYVDGVTADAFGFVYAHEGNQGMIYKYTSSGVFVKKWASGGFGLATDASGAVYIAGGSVIKFDADGNYLTEYSTLLRGARGVAVDAQGNIFVADTDGYKIVEYTSTGQVIRSWGSYGAGPGQFDVPVRIAVDNHGFVYVADAGNDRIEVFTTEGIFVTKWGSTGSLPGQFSFPDGIAVDGLGDVFVADPFNYRIDKFGPLPTPTLEASWGALKTRFH